MALKRLDENPRITDTLLFELTTPDADGCFTANPYKVDRVVVYYVERDFLGSNPGEYTRSSHDPELQAELEAAEKAYCDDPTPANAVTLERIRNTIDSSVQKTTFYYKDRVAVKVWGSEGFPAWLSTDTEESDLTLIEEDADGNPQFGHFALEWSPQGSVREGDFFICWTWTPLPAGDSLSAHIPFLITGDPAAVTSIPIHKTPEGKYEALLERYLPEMYKSTLANNDITPQTLDSLNRAVAKGFTFVEDMVNQIIDLFDANVLHESLLTYLSNFFNLKLKSSDPTLWRRQIKEAVPLFKKKGTLGGLQDSFAQAGMTLDRYTELWQLVSPYTWQESFRITEGDTSFVLSRDNVVTPIDTDNFGLWLRLAGEDTYDSLDPDYVEFETGDDLAVRMNWLGEEQPIPITLATGDILRVLYQYREIPGAPEQTLEDYYRSLPLADQRDEADQLYPPKNWNVRVITEDDAFFPLLIPVRHPFADPLVFGYVRTEFAYSENIYNQEEYNGSTRPSFDACRMDKNFIDPCGACLGSTYSVDVSVEELSNDRMAEAQEILSENLPFHAVLHTLGFASQVNEFVPPPVESVDFLVTMDRTQYVISGNVNPIFTRIMQDGLGAFAINRDALTAQTTVLSGKIGTAYNDHVAFVSPDINLQDLAVIESNHILEVLAPSPNAGTYQINHIDGHVARVATGVAEPVDEAAFTFNLSNITYGNTVSSITQDDRFTLADANIDFSLEGVKTQWDVNNTPDYTGGPWKVSIPAYSASPYEIVDIIDGVLVLDDNSTLPTAGASGVNYTLKRDDDTVVDTSTTGVIACERRGYVNLNDGAVLDIAEFARAGDFLLYSGTEYEILNFDDNNFWIGGYTAGNVAGVTVQIRRRLAQSGIGNFGYRGLHLTTFADHEAEFGMVNGENPPPENEVTDDSHFKENFLFLIGGEYYKIAAIDGVEVVLSGRDQAWRTAAGGGTVVGYSIIHLVKKEVNIQFYVFDQLGREGKDPVIREIESTVDNNVAIVVLSDPSGTALAESSGNSESVGITILRRDGSSQTEVI